MSAKKLGDFITLQRGTTYKSQLLGQSGAVLIGLASIHREGGFRDDKLETYGGECPEKISLRAGDLYVSLKDITHDGHLLGAVSRIPEKIKLGRLTQDTVKLVFLKNEFPRNYIYWLLRTPQCRNYCRSFQTGTTNLGLAREDFLSFSVPPLTDFASSIVGCLEAIEKKIENLRRQNETLEVIAQTLFKHWFIDFEFPNADGKPYKSSGGAMISSELGDIPEGWHFSIIGDQVETVGGGTPSTTEPSYWENGDIAWYSPTDLTKAKTLFSIDSEKKITSLGLQKSSAKLFPKYSLLLTSRATIGEVTINTKDACTNQGFITIIPNEKFNVYFLYGWLLTKIEIIKMLASGSTFPEISKSNFRGLDFLIPVSHILENYEQLIKPIYKKIENNIYQIQTLTKTRDALLPKLMSGQLRIKE
jgi:restriction endonuclease S subunit